MLIKFLSLVPIADAEGDIINQGAMVRYLAEIVSFPTAALADYISWEEVDSVTAKAKITELILHLYDQHERFLFSYVFCRVSYCIYPHGIACFQLSLLSLTVLHSESGFTAT